MSVRIPRHVFSEETDRPNFIDHSGDLIGKEPVVIGAELLSGNRVGLAGISGSDAMNAAAPWSAIEGCKVRPDRRLIQCSRRHMASQRCGGKGFPLHVSDAARAKSGKGNTGCDIEAETEAMRSGAQVDAGEASEFWGM